MTTGQFKIKFQNQSHIYWLDVTYPDISYRYLLATFWFLYIMNTFWIFYFWLVTCIVYTDGDLFSNYAAISSFSFFFSPTFFFPPSFLHFSLSSSLSLFLTLPSLLLLVASFLNYSRNSPLPVTMLNSSSSARVPVLWWGQISVVRQQQNMYQVLWKNREVKKEQFLRGAKDRMEEMGTFSVLNSLGVCQRNEDILSREKKQIRVQFIEHPVHMKMHRVFNELWLVGTSSSCQRKSGSIWGKGSSRCRERF